jgi:cytoskeletal protein CcmA (bactofilin family)
MKGLLGSSGGGASKNTSVDTLIGKQTEVLGDVRFSGGLHLDGKIKGNVSAADKTATLSVSETGCIEGDVNVPNIMLNGSVIGDVRATERLVIAAKARVSGNVQYRTLQMEPGAKINGQLVHESNEPIAALTHDKSSQDKIQAKSSTVSGIQEGLRSKAG